MNFNLSFLSFFLYLFIFLTRQINLANVLGSNLSFSCHSSVITAFTFELVAKCVESVAHSSAQSECGDRQRGRMLGRLCLGAHCHDRLLRNPYPLGAFGET